MIKASVVIDLRAVVFSEGTYVALIEKGYIYHSPIRKKAVLIKVPLIIKVTISHIL